MNMIPIQDRRGNKIRPGKANSRHKRRELQHKRDGERRTEKRILRRQFNKDIQRDLG